MLEFSELHIINLGDKLTLELVSLEDLLAKVDFSNKTSNHGVFNRILDIGAKRKPE
jgi:hypothetical protein